MMDAATFDYRPGNSPSHRLDPRFKLLGLAGATVSLLHAQAPGLILWSLFVGLCMAQAAIPIAGAARAFRPFFFLLVLVLAARALTTPPAGPESILIQARGVAVSREGLVLGGLICWRLALIFFLGMILTATTRTSAVRDAVAALLAPVPWVDQRRIALMIGLMFRFIPAIARHAACTADAQRARCVERRRNPVYRLKVFCLPLMRRVFMDADALADAMTARCHGAGARSFPLRAVRSDWIALWTTACVCLAAAFL